MNTKAASRVSIVFLYWFTAFDVRDFPLVRFLVTDGGGGWPMVPQLVNNVMEKVEHSIINIINYIIMVLFFTFILA